MKDREFVLEQILDIAHLPVLLGTKGIQTAQAMAKKIVDTMQAQKKLIFYGTTTFRDLTTLLAREFRTGLNIKRPPLPVITLNKKLEPSCGKDLDPMKSQLEKTAEAGDTLIVIFGNEALPANDERYCDRDHMESLFSTAGSLKVSALAFYGYPKPRNIQTDLLFYLPLANRSRLEEAFLIMGHIICTLVESVLFSDGNGG